MSTGLKMSLAAATIAGAAILGPAAQASPLPASPGIAAPAEAAQAEQVRWVCGPFRCWWRPGPRFYGYYGPARPRYWAYRPYWGPRHYWCGGGREGTSAPLPGMPLQSLPPSLHAPFPA